MAEPKRGERLPDGFYRFEMHPGQLAAFWTDLERAIEDVEERVSDLDYRALPYDRKSYAHGLWHGLIHARAYSDCLILIQEVLPEGFRELMEVRWEKAMDQAREAAEAD